MFSRISRRMAEDSATEINQESGDKDKSQEENQSSTERQIETPKRGYPSTSTNGDTSEPPRKLGRFELSGDSNNAWEINDELASYANKFIKNFCPNQKLVDDILLKNPVPSNIYGEFLLDPYLRELLSDKGKRVPINQDKSLHNLQKRIAFVYGPLSKIWTALEAEKEAFECNEDRVDEGKTEEGENPLKIMSDMMDQVVLLLGQAINTCSYIRRFNILMSFIGDKVKVDAMLKENAEAFKDSKEMLFGQKFEEVVTKSIASKNKSMEFFDSLNRDHQGSSGHREPKKQPFQRPPSFRARGNRGRGMFMQAGQSLQYNGSSKRGKNISSDSFVQYSRTPAIVKLSQGSSSCSETLSAKHPEPSKGGTFKILSKKLEGPDKRQHNFGHSSRIHHPFYFASQAIKASTSTHSFAGGNRTDRSGGQGDVEQRSHFSSRGSRGTICKLFVSGGKEGWGQSPSDKLEGFEQGNTILSLQNGGSFSAERNVTARRLHGKDRPKGRLFCSSSVETITEICQVSVERPSLRVFVPMLRFDICSKSLHQIVKGANILTKETLYQNYYLSGRYAADGIISRRATNSAGHPNIFASKLRFFDKFPKIDSGTDIDFGISRSSGGLTEHDAKPTDGENRESETAMQGNVRKTTGHSQRPKQINRSIVIHGSSSSSCTPSVSGITTRTNSRSPNELVPRWKTDSFKSGEGGVTLVDSKSKSLQREVFNFSASRAGHQLGCINSRLGGLMSGSINRGTMVSGGEKISHKCFRAESSKVGNNDFHNRQKGGNSSPYQDGQYGCPVILDEDGGDKESRISKYQQRNLEFPFVPQDHDYCRVSAGGVEHRSRQGIKGCQGFQRVETKQSDIQKDLSNLGNSGNRSICIKGFTPTSSIHVLEAGPIQQGAGCVPDKLESSLRLRFPPICSNRKGVAESAKGSSHNNNNYSSMASTTLVPDVTAHVSKNSIITPIKEGPSSGPKGQPTSSNRAELIKTSGLDHLRENLQTEGVSERASKLIINSRRTGTLRHYQSAWGKWVGWCDKQKISPTACDISYVLDYLANLFEQGLQYSTIGSHRSAISAFHNPIDGVKIGENPRVSDLMSGIFNQRPPQPRYTFIWDVEVVLKYLRTLPDNNLLSDKVLTLKLVLLLALTSASRASEMTNLNLRYFNKTPSLYVFYPCSLTKTWRRGEKPPEPIKFYSFPWEKKLCVCETLEAYFQKRESWGIKEKSQLLVSHVSPHKPICSSTVSRWLKEGLAMVGIDTQIFKGHSTRSASTSKAEASGASICDIMKQGHWSNESTFQRFYRREIIDPSASFQASLLKDML